MIVAMAFHFGPFLERPCEGVLASECTVLSYLLTGFPFKFEVLKVKFLIPKRRIILNKQVFSAIADGPMPLPVNRVQVSQGIEPLL